MFKKLLLKSKILMNYVFFICFLLVVRVKTHTFVAIIYNNEY